MVWALGGEDFVILLFHWTELYSSTVHYVTAFALAEEVESWVVFELAKAHDVQTTNAEVSRFVACEPSLGEVTFSDEFASKGVKEGGPTEGFVRLPTESLQLDDFRIEELDECTVRLGRSQREVDPILPLGICHAGQTTSRTSVHIGDEIEDAWHLLRVLCPILPQH